MLQDSGLKTPSSSSSSLSAGSQKRAGPAKMLKTGSVELKAADTTEKKERSMSIAEITLKKNVRQITINMLGSTTKS